MILNRFDAIRGHLRPGFNHKAIVQLFKKRPILISYAPRLVLPSERMKNDLDVKTRKLDEIALYGVGKAMEDAIFLKLCTRA